MKYNIPLNEDPEISCKVIAEIINNSINAYRKQLLLRDFLSKCENLDQKKILPLLVNLTPEIRKIIKLLPEKDLKNTREILKISEKNNELLEEVTVDSKKHFNVCILTIKSNELNSVKIAFDIDLNKDEDFEIDGLRCWEVSVYNKFYRKELKVLITCVTKTRGINCANACHSIFYNHNVDVAFLVGMAAGNKKVVKIGDTVSAQTVFDYEGGSLVSDGLLPKIEPYKLKPKNYMDLAGYFKPESMDWHNYFQDCLGKLSEIEEIPDESKEISPKFYVGVLFAGEKSIADGKTMDDLRDRFHKDGFVLDMEGSGFCSACEHHNIPWFIFRGITDYGYPNKPSMDKWQSVASLSAATSIKLFLLKDFRIRRD